VVTGRATPYAQECTDIGVGSESLQFCSYSKDEARYDSSYYPTTEDLLQRNSLVKSMCPGCRTAVEVAGSLKEINGAFVIETQGDGEADVLMTTFKAGERQASLEDIYTAYGIPDSVRPGPSPGTLCAGGLVGTTVSRGCPVGYRAVDVTKRYGEARYATSSTPYSNVFMSGIPYTIPDGRTIYLSGIASYTLTQDSFVCNTLTSRSMGYCAMGTENSDVTVTFTPPITAPAGNFNGWLYGGSCQTSHRIGIVIMSCPAFRACNCYVGGVAPNVQISSATAEFSQTKMSCTAPTCSYSAISSFGEQCSSGGESCIGLPAYSSPAVCSWTVGPNAGCSGCTSNSGATVSYDYRFCRAGTQACVTPTSGTNAGRLVCSSDHSRVCSPSRVVNGVPNDYFCTAGGTTLECTSWTDNQYCRESSDATRSCNTWLKPGVGEIPDRLVCSTERASASPTSCVFSSASWAWECPKATATNTCSLYNAVGGPASVQEPGIRAMGWGAMFVQCGSQLYPADFIIYRSPRYGFFDRTTRNLAAIENRIREILASNAGVGSAVCKRDSDIRTYYIEGAAGCNGAFNTTDMLVLNLEIDPATTRHTSADYEAWYTEMADAIVNYSSSETYTYGKPIVIYIRSMKDASGFNPEKFMTVLGLNMERMINAGVVAIHFEDWKKVSADGANAYATGSGYEDLLYAFDESGSPTATFSALSDLGRAVSKKISFSVSKATPIYNETTCLNSSTPCIADTACIGQDDIGTMKIRCYNESGAIKITYSMSPSSEEEDLAQIFANPDKYKSIIGSVNRYSNRKLCLSSIENSTYFTSYMSNAGYGIPAAWDQLQGQTCTATGLTNAEVLSLATGGASAYVCRLE
jgi:hypothetical protein